MHRSILLTATCLWLVAPAALRAATTSDTTSSTTTVHHLPGKTVATTHTTRKATTAGKTTTSHGVTRTTVSKAGKSTHVERSSHTSTVVSGAKKSTASHGVHQNGTHHPAKHGAAPRTVVKAAPKPAPAPVPVAAAPAKPALPPPDPAKGTDSGLPLPRFAALRSDQVSLRAGPGTRYPIDWVYQRRYLPVKIEREFEVWRLISEPDGTKGWVHEAMLTGRRGFLITADQPQTIRAAANDTAAPVAILKPGVVGRLLSCPAGADWCQVQVQSYKGWLPRTAFWGTMPSETIVAP